MNLEFQGLMAPVFTAFSAVNRQVDLSVIPAYAQFLAENGIRGVLVNGTSGEGMSLTFDERKRTAEEWISACKPLGIHVQVQVGGTNMVDVCRLAAHAELEGANSLLCLPELFNKPGDVSELVGYLAEVAKGAPKTPLLYYHNPAYTNVNVDVPLLMERARQAIPTFAGAKYTDTNLEVGVKSAAVDAGLTVLLGCDYVLASAFSLGLSSSIATSINVMPRLCRRIAEAVKHGDVAEAFEAQRLLNAATTVITKNGKWVTAMKAAMPLLTGLSMGPVRSPLSPFPTEHVAQMKKDLMDLKLL